MSLAAMTTRALGRILRADPAARIRSSRRSALSALGTATADPNRPRDERNPIDHRGTDVLAALQRAQGGMF